MFSTKNMHSVQNEQSIEMQNYYRWIGHYKNIVSDSFVIILYQQILIMLNQHIQIMEGCQNTLKKELKWMRYGFVKIIIFTMI